MVPDATRGSAARGSDSPVVIRAATKRFGVHTAIDGLDLEVPRGTVYGVLGPNGSGKTTCIRLVLGILSPDEGEVLLFGSPPNHSSRARVGYLPEERGLYPGMRVLDHLTFLAEVRGLSRHDARNRGVAWLDRFGLEEWSDRRVADLSKGMQQKVQFIGTILHGPELLILDEPFAGLDPINLELFESVVVELSRAGVTILLSTHQMDQAERLCDRVCLVAKAKKVLDGSLSEAVAGEAGEKLTLHEVFVRRVAGES